MHNRRKHFTSRFFIVLGVIVVLCQASTLYSSVTGKPSPASRVIGAVTSPLQRLVVRTSSTFDFLKYDDVKAENEALRAKIAEMQQQVRDAKLALAENDRLRTELGRATRRRDFTEESAEVIGRSPGDWATVLTLNKGTNHGVQINNLVRTDEGMVGYVSAVSSNSCQVTAVIDVEMQCGALITRSRDAAIAEGDYDLMADGNLRLSYLSEDTDIVIGDTVETSGTGKVFPQGVMIGTVERVMPENHGISYYAVVKPFVNVETVTNVNIVTDYTITE